MKDHTPGASGIANQPGQTVSTATGVPAVVFVAGVLMEAYGLYWVLAPGSVNEGLLWMAGGLLSQVASGAHARRRDGLVNPFRALAEDLRAIRRRVGTWDHKQ